MRKMAATLISMVINQIFIASYFPMNVRQFPDFVLNSKKFLDCRLIILIFGRVTTQNHTIKPLSIPSLQYYRWLQALWHAPKKPYCQKLTRTFFPFTRVLSYRTLWQNFRLKFARQRGLCLKKNSFDWMTGSAVHMWVVPAAYLYLNCE